jgi:hypothetical protein
MGLSTGVIDRAHRAPSGAAPLVPDPCHPDNFEELQGWDQYSRPRTPFGVAVPSPECAARRLPAAFARALV